MTVVRYRLTQPGGAPRAHESVKVSLAVRGFDTAAHTEISSVAQLRTAVNGAYSIDLLPNDSPGLEPAGTYYLIQHGSDEALPVQVLVAHGPGPLDLDDPDLEPNLLIETPAAPGPVVVGVTPAELAAAVSAAIAAVVAAAPGQLDTLDELAAALGDDANFAATVTAALGGKQPLDADLTAIAQLATAAYGRSLLEAASAPAARTLLGLGTAATHAATDFATPADVTAAIAALVNGAPGALDTLNEIAVQLAGDESAAAALTTAVGNRLRTDQANTLTSGQKTQLRTDLGLGTIATKDLSDYAPGAGTGPTPARIVTGPTLPPLPSGTEYVWMKTDGIGTLLDIVSGKAA